MGGERFSSTPGGSMGTAKRRPMSNSQTRDVPGPNAYQLGSKVGDGPAYFMGEKTKAGADHFVGSMGVPGPGAYDPVKVSQV